MDVLHEQRHAAAEFTVEPGDTVALLGPNGVGKSTVFGVIAGLVAPDRGAVQVGERCVVRAGTELGPCGSPRTVGGWPSWRRSLCCSPT